ncbi:4df2d0d0-fd33-414d-84de-0e1924f6dfe0-CDS [Sclerotinia trifoliorum]|uniref:Ribosomal RNA-processing protein 8 n=1 Tax=Sclerotinia trifoliorum TaxID=28548 RepID=A0A8H2VZT5_9HELO|nr:4df2d0d0-fd33-414d-84de-0e1924f6dfe0-CDS [Sclerotinia trifoliorum]
MFAVPGWSVSSSLLKTQTAEPVAAAPKGEEEGVPVETKSSKKRKRAKNPDVNAANLSELWESVIEGKPKTKKVKNAGKDGEAKEKKEKVVKETSTDGIQNESVEPSNDSAEISESKNEKKQKKKKKDKDSKPSENDQSMKDDTPDATSTKLPKPVAKLTPLQASMRQKLISARFRHLNQSLYTTPSSESLATFQQNPEMFTEYHEGFRRQVEVWPENPVDGYSLQIRQRGKLRRDMRGQPAQEKTDLTPLPRTDGTCRIADLGCGDAALSTGLQKDLKKLNLKIHSFDLQSPSPLVTRADIANLPLEDGSIDIAIFCLALMGTNWIDFIEEAFRILRWKGELWIAEIKSRFGRVGGSNKKVVEHSVGHRKKNQPINKKAIKAADDEADEADLMVHVDGNENNKQETDVSAFVEVLKKRGFVLQTEKSVDLSNKMFVKMHFVKGATPIKGKCVPISKGAPTGETWKKKPKAKFLEEPEDVDVSNEAAVLKPCVYKLR